MPAASNYAEEQVAVSLRKMAETYGVEPGPGTTAVTSDRVALTFVVNSDFLPGLKMLAFSMVRAGTLLDLPISFVTDEESVLDDPFVRAVGDAARVVTAAEIAEFADIPSSLIPDSVRLEWIPKYTFLKWTIFDHSPFERLIWIDADVLCLRPVDHLATLAEADLYGAPTFSPELVGPDPENRLPSETRRDHINAFVDAPEQYGHTLNSGVMVVNQPLLDPAFRASLIEWATLREVTTEQMVVRQVIDASDTLSRAPLSPLDNFHSGYLRFLRPRPRQEMLSRINLVHYVGAKKKPWRATGTLDTPTTLWWEMQDRAAQCHPDLAVARPQP